LAILLKDSIAPNKIQAGWATAGDGEGEPIAAWLKPLFTGVLLQYIAAGSHSYRDCLRSGVILLILYDTSLVIG